MKNRVLFVTEKWCDGSPAVGMTNNLHQTIHTFQQAKATYNFNTIHLDEASVTYGTHIDEILPKYCLQWDINIVFFCLLGNSPLNPSRQTYNALKSLGIRLCFIWPDTGPGWATDTMYDLQDVADLQVSWDQAQSEFHSNLSPLANYLRLWAPQDDTLYFKPVEDRVTDVTFLGSRYYPLRQDAVQYLASKLPSLSVSGGQREAKLSPTEYAKKIRQSKILLNLPHHPLGFWQLKSRVLEGLACETLVIELKNPATSQLLTAGQDYVEADSLEDMVEKTQFYLHNPEAGAIIAHKGYITYHAKYTAQHYWDMIFYHIKV